LNNRADMKIDSPIYGLFIFNHLHWLNLLG